MYADHAASSFPSPYAQYGNPSASHAVGRRARAAADDARVRLGQALGLRSGDVQRLNQQLIVTSGGTESNNMVLQQPRWRFIVLSPIEHHSVLTTAQFVAADRGVRLHYVAPDATGAVTPEALRQTLSGVGDGPGLVTVAAINNEIGTVQNIRGLAGVVAEANRRRPGPEQAIAFHTDAVQVPGHAAIELDDGGEYAGVDFMSLSAHKFHGPAGIGLLFCRSPPLLTRPLLFGGHQQNDLRPGTEAVDALVAMSMALQDAQGPLAAQRIALYRSMTDAIRTTLLPFVVAGRVLLTGGAPDRRAPHLISFCVRNGRRQDLVARMEAMGVMVSGGSACTSGETTLPSHVLAAIGVPADFVHGSVRISLSHTNTLDEVTNVLCPALVRLLRSD